MSCPNCMNAGGLCADCEATVMSKQATPRPWGITETTDKHWIIDSERRTVAVLTRFTDSIRTANAELIVRAVNCHDELVAIVKRINAHLVNPNALGDLIDDAERVLEKARGGE